MALTWDLLGWRDEMADTPMCDRFDATIRQDGGARLLDAYDPASGPLVEFAASRPDLIDGEG